MRFFPHEWASDFGIFGIENLLAKVLRKYSRICKENYLMQGITAPNLIPCIKSYSLLKSLHWILFSAENHLTKSYSLLRITAPNLIPCWNHCSESYSLVESLHRILFPVRITAPNLTSCWNHCTETMETVLALELGQSVDLISEKYPGQKRSCNFSFK